MPNGPSAAPSTCWINICASPAYPLPQALLPVTGFGYGWQGKKREVFMVLYLDNQHRLLESETLFAGSVNHVQVHSREVVKSALCFNAAAVVLAHNHPSGDPEPSQCDRNITGRLKEALALVDVKTLDHLIVGSDGIVSFAERGWI